MSEFIADDPVSGEIFDHSQIIQDPAFPMDEIEVFFVAEDPEVSPWCDCFLVSTVNTPGEKHSLKNNILAERHEAPPPWMFLLPSLLYLQAEDKKKEVLGEGVTEVKQQLLEDDVHIAALPDAVPFSPVGVQLSQEMQDAVRDAIQAEIAAMEVFG